MSNYASNSAHRPCSILYITNQLNKCDRGILACLVHHTWRFVYPSPRRALSFGIYYSSLGLVPPGCTNRIRGSTLGIFSWVIHLMHEAVGRSEADATHWVPVTDCWVHTPCIWSQSSWTFNTPLGRRFRWARNCIPCAPLVVGSVTQLLTPIGFYLDDLSVGSLHETKAQSHIILQFSKRLRAQTTW